MRGSRGSVVATAVALLLMVAACGTNVDSDSGVTATSRERANTPMPNPQGDEQGTRFIALAASAVERCLGDQQQRAATSHKAREQRLRAQRIRAQRAAAQRQQRERPESTFTVATFNVLGGSHAPGDGTRRIDGVIGMLRQQDVAVVALQELQRPQASAFAAGAGEYTLVPGVSGTAQDGENSVAFRSDRFELVNASALRYPYFGRSWRSFPLLLLRDKATGTQFRITSFHNPADTKKFGRQAGNRRTALNMEIADAKRLMATKTPLIFAGDMNDRIDYFCPMASATGMRSADGGTAVGGCQPPPAMWIDWLMGSPEVTFSNYRRLGARGVSDHPLVVATAQVRGR